MLTLQSFFKAGFDGFGKQVMMKMMMAQMMMMMTLMLADNGDCGRSQRAKHLVWSLPQSFKDVAKTLTNIPQILDKFDRWELCKHRPKTPKI